MRKLRILLLPIGWMYGLITGLRNCFYNWGILAVWSIPKKSISIGNLSMGGTGKTPLVDYIVQHFLLQNKQLATLSRGYGRASHGPRIVSNDSSASEVGDEPRMYKQKYGNQLLVAVAEKRKAGVELILNTEAKTEIIVLDDAFQHRAIKAGFSILVTEYHRPFSKDFIVPAGNLREAKFGRHRADAVLVSKCPELTAADKERFKTALRMKGKPIFFARIAYGKLQSFAQNTAHDSLKNVLLVTGIGNPEPLYAHLANYYRVELLEFRDHHAFSAKDIRAIHEKFDTFASRDKIIVTTEKDYMRIGTMEEIVSHVEHWFYQPIRIQIDEEEKFNRLLNDYVDKD